MYNPFPVLLSCHVGWKHECGSNKNPLFFSAVLYSPFAVLKMVSLEELSNNLHAMNSGICLMMGG